MKCEAIRQFLDNVKKVGWEKNDENIEFFRSSVLEKLKQSGEKPKVKLEKDAKEEREETEEREKEKTIGACMIASSILMSIQFGAEKLCGRETNSNCFTPNQMFGAYQSCESLSEETLQMFGSNITKEECDRILRVDRFGNVVSFFASPQSVLAGEGDHWVPKKFGGNTVVGNLAYLHHRANNCKKDSLPQLLVPSALCFVSESQFRVFFAQYGIYALLGVIPEMLEVQTKFDFLQKELGLAIKALKKLDITFRSLTRDCKHAMHGGQ
eukprot:Colp12_sorted_trinity150504_noHs@26810